MSIHWFSPLICLIVSSACASAPRAIDPPGDRPAGVELLFQHSRSDQPNLGAWNTQLRIWSDGRFEYRGGTRRGYLSRQQLLGFAAQVRTTRFTSRVLPGRPLPPCSDVAPTTWFAGTDGRSAKVTVTCASSTVFDPSLLELIASAYALVGRSVEASHPPRPFVSINRSARIPGGSYPGRPISRLTIWADGAWIRSQYTQPRANMPNIIEVGWLTPRETEALRGTLKSTFSVGPSFCEALSLFNIEVVTRGHGPMAHNTSFAVPCGGRPGAALQKLLVTTAQVIEDSLRRSK